MEHIQDLKDVSVNADLNNVSAPLSDLANGNTSAIKIGELEAQVTIKASDLNRVDPLTKIEDLRIYPSSVRYVETGQDSSDGSTTTANNSDGQDQSKAGVRVSGNVQIAGQKIEIFAFALIEVHGTTIDIIPKRLQYGNDKESTVVPQAVQQALLPNFKASFDTGTLPFQVTPKAVQVNDGSVTIKGKAQNVTFSGR